VVRNELNLFLQPHGLFFTPETSTANRAMIGGMVGNNSCGANSIVYGTTREHLVRARGFLSDGTEATFGPLTAAEFAAKCAGPDSLETRIYQTVRALLNDEANRRLVREHFPKPTVTRRNTGYALDRLMDCEVFDPGSTKPFNLCQLIAGSEGTLFLGTEFELNCEPVPPPGALMCIHFPTVHEALQATLIAMRHRPHGCELIDRHILECTKANLEHAKNRFFVQGDPGAGCSPPPQRNGAGASPAGARPGDRPARGRREGGADLPPRFRRGPRHRRGGDGGWCSSQLGLTRTRAGLR
jgi:FAD/FMN-containing dehydrogenase